MSPAVQLPAVQIRLLGEFSVAVDDVAVGGLHSARLQSLLRALLRACLAE